jgi:hypothetical protein
VLQKLSLTFDARAIDFSAFFFLLKTEQSQYAPHAHSDVIRNVGVRFACVCSFEPVFSY